MAASSELSALELYPTVPRETLARHYVGKKIEDLDTPAPILDAALIRKHCQDMLDATRRLGWAFRAHVKSHKTIEITELQVGSSGAVNLVVSTICEAEHLIPFVQTCQKEGRAVSLIYGFPAPPGSYSRLAALSHQLGPKVLKLLVDDIACCSHAAEWAPQMSGGLPLLIKVDSAYGRAGRKPESDAFRSIVERLCALEAQTEGLRLEGLYSHGGHSYGADHGEVVHILDAEIIELSRAGSIVASIYDSQPERRFLVSLGATPTALAASNNALSAAAHETVGKASRLDWELHAGVYPLLDIQQATTQSLDGNLSSHGFARTPHDIALRILVEVVTIYDERDPPQALVTVGTLGLGREPCKHYPGWAIVSPWRSSRKQSSRDDEPLTYDPVHRTGWILGKISQEHGILTWEGSRTEHHSLTVGEKLLIWPNHACIAGAAYDWYYVVDSENNAEGDDVVHDVWVRWRGW